MIPADQFSNEMLGNPSTRWDKLNTAQVVLDSYEDAVILTSINTLDDALKGVLREVRAEIDDGRKNNWNEGLDPEWRRK